ncbi:type II toxin-antitoxin system HicB family antitoxin [Mesorhizobium sp. J428]|uniref:type II toxin-antitoxin system HicB family antitoxin n=1 Tax=Mesorhizobium sp. J428 TaxID=2898440 RepID=UPI0021512022|nr:type II toxin-antitoxin system HicB family antitoxin [Mesorhizobium sp. J428]MCR5858667.1 type II toxin-antitoxin system HicB family antitoxin [Mesorhizobium sp. J428]
MPRNHAIAVFWSDADKAWIADAPNLKPCSAFGATPEEAVSELRAAMAAWIETAKANGMPLPEPLFRQALPAAE